MFRCEGLEQAPQRRTNESTARRALIYQRAAGSHFFQVRGALKQASLSLCEHLHQLPDLRLDRDRVSHPIRKRDHKTDTSIRTVGLLFDLGSARSGECSHFGGVGA